MQKFRNVFDYGDDPISLDLSRQTEPIFLEIEPFAVDTDTGEILNKTSKPIIKQIGEQNVYDKIQSYKDDVDIYNILKRFSETGDSSLLNKRVGTFMDIADLPDNIHDFNKMLADAAEKYNNLDESIKENIFNDDKLNEIISLKVKEQLANNVKDTVEKKEVK